MAYSRISVTFLKKLSANEISVMSATIQFRIFCLFIRCPKSTRIKIHSATVLPVVLYGMELGLSCKRKNMVTRICRPRRK
jgi:hypothetical protein